MLEGALLMARTLVDANPTGRIDNRTREEEARVA